MRNKILLGLAFSLGFWARGSVVPARAESPPRVTGIGGVFFKSSNPAALKQWYSKHLGLELNGDGALLKWKTLDDKPGCTQWAVFKAETSYFAPSKASFMINYRVDHLEALIPVLKSEGVTVVDKMEVYSYGRFVHILDPDGNKLELWEPQ